MRREFIFSWLLFLALAYVILGYSVVSAIMFCTAAIIDALHTCKAELLEKSK